LSVGVPLIRKGRRHNHKDHDSLVFTGNAYYWNSRQEKGNAVDYLVRHMGMSFVDAVAALAGGSHLVSEADTFTHEAPKASHNCRKAVAYLHKSRGIDYSIIRELIDSQHLMQEEKTNNAVFPMYDESGNVVGAELEGTLSDRRFKGVSAGSAYGYGFNIRNSSDKTYDFVLFFESAVDLLSFMDIKRNQQGKSLNRCLLVSMAGLKPNVVKHSLKAFKGSLRPVLCVDRDNAGDEFRNAIHALKIDFRACFPDEGFKDWNEQLLCYKRNIANLSTT